MKWKMIKAAAKCPHCGVKTARYQGTFKSHTSSGSYHDPKCVRYVAPGHLDNELTYMRGIIAELSAK